MNALQDSAIAIRTHELTLQHDKRLLCKNISITIAKHHVVGILGANGCGKTTMLHTLAGLRHPRSGHIYLNQRELSGYSSKSLARQRGILFQDFQTALPISVNEYCTASRYPYYRFNETLSCEDSQLISNMVNQMDLASHLYQPVTTLSGGEKRRLALAALFIQAPQLYLLDEPTNHLDVKHQVHVLHYLRELALTQQATIIMSLHDVNIAQVYCDELILMFSDGTILQGKPNDVLTVDNLSRLYECQMSPMTMLDGTTWWRASLSSPYSQNQPPSKAAQ